MNGFDYVIAGLAALAAGMVNAVAGGGTLITFPTLVALGVPTVSSNITNTVALCPGYFGGTLAQRGDLAGQKRRLRVFAALAAVGGLTGSILLVISSEELFRNLVPFLVLGACALLVGQDRIRGLLPARAEAADDGPPGALAVGAMLLTCIYGGYFGAGMGIVTLATLGIAVPDTFPRTNALKQAVTLVTNVVAALFFVSSGDVVWGAVLVMAPAALLGGNLGGRLARVVNPRLMRGFVVAIGVAVALQFWL